VSDYPPEYDPPVYELVMPFVVVQSQGGPYDDDAFQAGWLSGWLDARLERNDHSATWAPVTLRPQIDLIAMKHGFVTEDPEYVDDDFGWFSFRPSAEGTQP
jgi:hypothetical protein